MASSIKVLISATVAVRGLVWAALSSIDFSAKRCALAIGISRSLKEFGILMSSNTPSMLSLIHI